MKKVICAALVYTLTIPTSALFAAEPAAAGTSPAAPGIQASATRAVQSMTLASTPAPNASEAAFPRTLPRDGKRFNSGGGAMVAISLISTIAGVAGSYYVYKMMKDQNKSTTTAGMK